MRQYRETPKRIRHYDAALTAVKWENNKKNEQFAYQRIIFREIHGQVLSPLKSIAKKFQGDCVKLSEADCRDQINVVPSRYAMGNTLNGTTLT